MRRIRRSVGVAGAALVMTATGVALAPTASAAQSDCPRGHVCVWDNPNFSGLPRWKSQGNLSGLHSENGMSIVNNGVADPGADHIRWRVTWDDGQYASGCLHYPPDSNAHRFTGGGGVTLNSAVWGPEC
ncbi:peptidase inhibitor family I36 protein [Streptomyces avicenniae]|uniref:peptidase inhibitor family I36 protein n=1 Tax=Streptomyces avicenniae TaxID=500153 RepID=UPI000DA5FF79|nr:peptidase inhibitor family I36 protein [Streptomyces avicenniae]